MDVWRGKIAVVTGASSGVGQTICIDLCAHGIIVFGIARSLEKLEKLMELIQNRDPPGQFFPMKCDLTDEEQILSAFNYVKANYGGIDILINNAALTMSTSFLDKDNLNTLKMIVDTNLVGLISCTKKAYESMSDREQPGYIINISSVAGHSIPNIPGIKPTINVYPATKHALTALITVLRHELNYFNKTKIRASNISPGMVKSGVFKHGIYGDLDNAFPMLEPQDISDAVMYLLGTNPRVQIEDFIIRPTGEIF